MEHVASVLTQADTGLTRARTWRSCKRDPGIGWLGQLLLDELRPSPEGFVHEVEAAWG